MLDIEKIRKAVENAEEAPTLRAFYLYTGRARGLLEGHTRGESSTFLKRAFEALLDRLDENPPEFEDVVRSTKPPELSK
jgi:hypothetical protein